MIVRISFNMLVDNINTEIIILLLTKINKFDIKKIVKLCKLIHILIVENIDNTNNDIINRAFYVCLYYKFIMYMLELKLITDIKKDDIYNYRKNIIFNYKYTIDLNVIHKLQSYALLIVYMDTDLLSI